MFSRRHRRRAVEHRREHDRLAAVVLRVHHRRDLHRPRHRARAARRDLLRGRRPCQRVVRAGPRRRALDREAHIHRERHQALARGRHAAVAPHDARRQRHAAGLALGHRRRRRTHRDGPRCRSSPIVASARLRARHDIQAHRTMFVTRRRHREDVLGVLRRRRRPRSSTGTVFVATQRRSPSTVSRRKSPGPKLTVVSSAV